MLAIVWGCRKFGFYLRTCTCGFTGILLRGDRICIPASLQQRVVTKQLLRSNIWFPRMNQLVDHFIANCGACQGSMKQKKSTPLAISKLPTLPFNKIVWHNIIFYLDIILYPYLLYRLLNRGCFTGWGWGALAPPPPPHSLPVLELPPSLVKSWIRRFANNAILIRE